MPKDIMAKAVVEVVCGTILEPCPRSEPCACLVPENVCPQDPREGQASVTVPGPQRRERFIFCYDENQKIVWLLDTLKRAIELVKQSEEYQQSEFKEFAYALELEPGSSYLLRDEKTLRNFHDHLLQCEFRDHVGYNLDLAHWLIANVPVDVLSPKTSCRDIDPDSILAHIAHAHISDHPGHPDRRMHTRDLPVGSHSAILHDCGEYFDYLGALTVRCHHETLRVNGEAKGGVPFTKAVAIELEGCARLFWIHDSITRLRYLIKVAEERYLVDQKRLSSIYVK
jgi:hypothetical protein